MDTPTPETVLVDLNIEQLSFAEMEALEEASGLPWYELTSKVIAPDAKLLRCLTWIFIRRKNPAITLEEVAAMHLDVADFKLPRVVEAAAQAAATGESAGNGRGKGRPGGRASAS